MAVGEEIICFCSSCNLDLRHVIVAHKSGNSGPIAKVRCNTCAKIHAFRNNPATVAAKKAATPRGAAAPREKVQVIPLEVEWREQLRSKEKSPSIKYTPSHDFKVGDVLDHPSFGCGIVRSLKEGNKFEVLFQREIKVLVHRLKTS